MKKIKVDKAFGEERMIPKLIKIAGSILFNGNDKHVYTSFTLVSLLNTFSKVAKCDALRDLVAFVQFKKREKHPWRSVNFSKVAD